MYELPSPMLGVWATLSPQANEQMGGSRAEGMWTYKHGVDEIRESASHQS